MAKLVAEDFAVIKNMPRHVAIIMDGNGRWAKRRLMPRSVGHRYGTERVKEMVRLCSDIGLEVLTLYAFSTENWKRPKDEVGVLMRLLVEYLRGALEEMNKNGVVFKMLGEKSRLPEIVQEVVENAEETTKNNSGLKLCVAINYGSRAEIVEAARALAEDYKSGKITEINQEAFESRLSTAGLPDPDLVIRTSGEQRISNLLMYQIAYSELYFTDTYWPDFDPKCLFDALKDYENRSRRYGAAE